MGKFRERNIPGSGRVSLITPHGTWNSRGQQAGLGAGTCFFASDISKRSLLSRRKRACCAQQAGRKQGGAAGHLLLGRYAVNSHQQGLRRGQGTQTQDWTATKPEKPLPSVALSGPANPHAASDKRSARARFRRGLDVPRYSYRRHSAVMSHVIHICHGSRAASAALTSPKPSAAACSAGERYFACLPA